MNLPEAENVAATFISMISPFCTRIEITGSIRRGKPEPGDIEILCTPKTGESVTPVLFGDPIKKEINFLHDYMMGLLDQDIVQVDRVSKDGRKAPFGPKYYRITYQGTPVDLFCVLPPADWWPRVVVTTGCAEFSHWLVTEAWKHNLKFKDGHIQDISGGTVSTDSEEHVFRLCGIEYLPPEQRGPDFLSHVKYLKEASEK